MKLRPSIPYPESEQPMLDQLADLFREWNQHFLVNGSPLQKQRADGMVSDGFYPHYFDQRKRILFIGRESRGIPGCNYMDVLHWDYRVRKRIGTQHLNRSKFHSRMIRITYGIMNGMPPWPSIPLASKIGDTLFEAGGLSFAFMNISKLSNEGGGWPSDWGTINSAHTLSCSGRSFNRDEVAILKPHIVITMNLRDKIDSLGTRTLIHQSDLARSYWIDSDGHRSLLIDTFHFSAPRKCASTDFYTPICDEIRRSEKSVAAC